MPDPVPAGNGGPPVPQIAGEAPVQPAEGNVSVLDYAQRKLREKKQAQKSAEGQPTGDAQKQPSTPTDAPESKSVLSQPAVQQATQQSDRSDSSDSVPQEEPRTEIEADSAEDDALPADAPEWMQKRIARFTRQKHELQRQIEEATAAQTALQSQLAQLKGNEAPPQPTEQPLPVVVAKGDPAGHLVNEQQVDQALDQAREVRRWCNRNPEGGVYQLPDGKGGMIEREFTAQQVMTLREAAEDDIEKHLPRRRQYLQQEQALTSQAVREHPWLTDAKSPRVAAMRRIMAHLPEIRLRPDWAGMVAIAARGLEVVEREKAEATKAVTPPRPKPGTPPPKIPGPSPTGPRNTGPAGIASAEVEAAEKEWKANPSQKTFARLQVAKRQQRQQPS